jgi:hypothetical protein
MDNGVRQSRTAVSWRNGAFDGEHQEVLDFVDNQLISTRWRGSRRVAPGRFLPGAPTDPDVQISRIRLFETWLRYAIWTAGGSRSG